MAQLKIVHVIQTMASRYGGPVSVLKALAKEQYKAGHKVTILTTNRDYPTGELCPPGERYLEETQVLVKYFRAEIPFFSLSRDLAREFWQIFPQNDVVHIWGLYRFPHAYAGFCARSLGIPYIIRPCGALEPPLRINSAISLPLKKLYEKLIELPNLRGAAAINCVTKAELLNLQPLDLPTKKFVVGNGIDWPRYEHLPLPGAFRLMHKLGNTPLILFLGRINFKKGLDLLVPAFGAVRKLFPDAQLVIAGPENDAYGDKVRGWVHEHGLEKCVHFVGHLEEEEVIRAYVDADIFALPSYTENFGMTVIEAMACGLPVVISDQVNIHDVVVNAGAGLVTRCDVDEISEALISLLTAQERRSDMGAAGRHAVQTLFSWDSVIQTLTNEYEEVIGLSHSVKHSHEEQEGRPRVANS